MVEGKHEGYFSKLLEEKGGDGLPQNLQSFKFEEEVLNQYKDLAKKNPIEFRFEDSIGIYINYFGKWSLKCNRNRDGKISALLIDLSHIPTDQQEWWFDHLIVE